jgi:hypothetical protein
VGALGGEACGDRRAIALSGAGYQRNPSVEQHGVLRSVVDFEARFRAAENYALTSRFGYDKLMFGEGLPAIAPPEAAC